MPDSAIASLTALTVLASVDEFVIVDKSDATMAASGTTKRMTVAALLADPLFLNAGLEAAKPAAVAALAGRRYFATDTLRDWLCDGTGWIIMSEPTITTHAPNLVANAGTLTTVGAQSFRYSRSCGWVRWGASFAITTNGTGAGSLGFTLPVATASRVIGTGREDNLNGHMLNCTGSGTLGGIGKYDNTYPGANGCLLNVGGSYEMASRYT